MDNITAGKLIAQATEKRINLRELEVLEMMSLVQLVCAHKNDEPLTERMTAFEHFYKQELMERGASREAAENKVRKKEGTYVDWETYDAFRVFEAGVQHGRNK